MRIIIAGSRNTKDAYSLVVEAYHKSGFFCREYPVSDVILSGHSGNVDMAGEKFALENGFDLEIYPPNWKGRGSSAGPYRNARMVEVADALILIWDGKSKGSRDILGRARAKGLRVYESKVGGVK